MDLIRWIQSIIFPPLSVANWREEREAEHIECIHVYQHPASSDVVDIALTSLTVICERGSQSEKKSKQQTNDISKFYFSPSSPERLQLITLVSQ